MCVEGSFTLLLCPLAAPTPSTGKVSAASRPRLLVGQQRHLVGRAHRGERPARRGREARGVRGGDPRPGPSSVRAAVRGSSVSSLPLQPPQSQWGTRLTRTDGASVSRAQGALLPVRRRCSGGSRAADPQPAVKARAPVQRRLPCSSTARSAPRLSPRPRPLKPHKTVHTRGLRSRGPLDSLREQRPGPGRPDCLLAASQLKDLKTRAEGRRAEVDTSGPLDVCSVSDEFQARHSSPAPRVLNRRTVLR